MLHRNPSGCQAGRDCCTETRLAAKWGSIAAPKLARLPSGPSNGRSILSVLWHSMQARRRGARGNVRRLVLPAERVTRNGTVGDEPVLQTFEQALGFGGAVDSVAAEAVLGGDDARVFQAQECLVGG